MRVRAKICGITSVEDGLAAAAAGCDAVGLNFFPASARYIDVETASAIAGALPPLVTRVGVFVDAPVRDIERVLAAVAIDVLQFHGSEDGDACASFGLPYVKVAGMRADLRIEALEEAHPLARAFLLDTHDPVSRGGTGRTFDWSLWPAACGKPLMLAGGLTPGNVGGAIRRLRPYAVDVCGGVEDGVKGVKSVTRMRAFMREVQDAAIQ